MKNLKQILTENKNVKINESANDFRILEHIFPLLFNALTYESDIIDYVNEYADEFGTEEYINWGEYSSLDSDLAEVMMTGDTEDEEYALVLHCGEAAWSALENGNDAEDAYDEALKKVCEKLNEELKKIIK